MQNEIPQKKPHRNAAFVKNQLGSVTPKENEFKPVINYLFYSKHSCFA
jgi:hypothetical protein